MNFKRLIFILPVTLSFLVSCGEDEFSRALKELDEAVENRNEYYKSFRDRQLPLYDVLNAAESDSIRFCTSYSLAMSYASYSIDSLMKYSELMSQYAVSDKVLQHYFLSECVGIHLQRITRNYTEGMRMVEALDPSEMVDSVRLRYYEFSSNLYYSLFIRADKGHYLNHDRDWYRERLRAMRRDFVNIDSTSTGALYMKFYEFRDDGDDARAQLLMNELKERITSNEDAARYWRQMANITKKTDPKKWNACLAMASCYSIRSGSRDMLSLSELTRSMTAAPSLLPRASRYAYAAAYDAARYKYPSRVNWAIDSLSQVSLAMAERTRTYNIVLSSFLITLLLLLLLSIFAILYHKRDKRRLVAAHMKLKESDMIKDGYLFNYMLRLSDTVSVADEYHRELRRIAKSDGPEAVLAKLKAPSKFEKDARTFYSTFDEIFLSIFPSFVQTVNSAMKPSCEYTMQPDELLSTEMRVLALLRLGMNDSKSMADFLHVSISTVYTYRSRAAEKSVFEREVFEDFIKGIHVG